MKKLSKYSHMFSTDQGYFIYSGLTNSFAKIDEEIYEILINKDLDSLTIEERGLLLDLNFLADKDEEDAFFNKQKFIYNNRNFDYQTLGLAIIPTSNCNFSCFYCFETNKTKTMMNDDTIDNLITFIKSYEDIKILDVAWYGGEPLLGFKVIKKIIGRIKKDLSHLNFFHTLVTNGSLLTREISEFFNDNLLSSMQVTLDGDEKRHDKVRFYKSGKGSFNKILDNLDIFFKYNQKTSVTLRINLDKYNEDSFNSLFVMLHERYKGKKLYIYPAFIENYTDMPNCEILNRYDKIKFTIKKYKELGFTANNINTEFSYGGCGATRKNYFLVGSEGELYKCWNDVGNQEMVVGHISNSEITNPKVLYSYISGETKYDDPKCKDCSIFPICSGGCQWQRNANKYANKNYDLCDLKKGSMDKFLEILYLESRKKKTISVKKLNL